MKEMCRNIAKMISVFVILLLLLGLIPKSNVRLTVVVYSNSSVGIETVEEWIKPIQATIKLEEGKNHRDYIMEFKASPFAILSTILKCYHREGVKRVT
jgi:hypothetical protein